MSFRGRLRGVLLALFASSAMMSPAGAPLAASFSEFVDPNPASGNQFGSVVVALSTGNVLITSPFDDAGGLNAGAVYLFDGSTGVLISTMRGSTANDNVGSSGVTVLSNGNYVVRSPNWDNGGVANVGAVTWGSATSGVSGVVSAANSLIGSTASDQVGSGGVIALSNGNYVVRSQLWNNGGIVDAGAASWGSGTSGVSGVVSAANSLVGSTATDQVGSGGVTALTNGNYVVGSPSWNNGGIVDAGAATWGSGTSGVSGVVSAANSLVGSTASDLVGGGVTALSNGNYVVATVNWDNGAVANSGAATWRSGTSGVGAVISVANSLVGSTAGDNVGQGGATALSNGNYVVASPNWNNGATTDAGAVTWGSGASGVSGVVSAANSLVGSTASDVVASHGVTPLPNGNYVVRSTNWSNGGIGGAGAATWASGTSGLSGAVSAANSLVGSAAGDNIGGNGLTVLSNGNYVVLSANWRNGGTLGAGAATWGSATSGVSGLVSAANSLVGSTASDFVGIAVTALSNGNYVVVSPNWNNGGVLGAGAASWGSGTSGVSGVVSAANSLVGSTAGDFVANNGVTALSNGNYVVRSPNWSNGGNGGAGAATWGSGTSGVSGAVSAANSLVGSTANDNVSSFSVTALSNGNYVVASPDWDNGGAVNVGAATLGSGTSGVSGAVSAANSLVGSTAGDIVGSGGVAALSNGNYMVRSASWDNGGVVNAGAASLGNGTTGVSGAISATHSMVGATASTNLQPLVVDNVNGTFIARFLAEGGGRVRFGPLSPVIVGAVDIPADQGGWLRLTFTRSAPDIADASPPVATYGVWRHVPGTISADAGRANRSALPVAVPDVAAVGRLRAALPPDLDAHEEDGSIHVTASAPRTAEPTAAFPPGTWALVTSVPAVQHAQYLADIPTITNAAPNDYVVTAHTTTPSIWFISDAMSGQSVDNLAPAPPTQLAGAYAGGQTNLQWAANTENDLGSYRVYRGTSAGFTPGPGNLLATVVVSSHSDVGPLGGYYKVSAVDVNGNESGFALLTPGGTTDVEEEGPIVFALAGARPNPTSGRGLNVAFALPVGAAARLELLDVSGRQVLAREVGSLGAGRHTVNMAEDRRLAPGLYWLRLVQGPNRRTTRVTVIE